MRLDKFLKVSRMIKRRAIANEVCDAGRVTANGRPVKASYAVKVGDVLKISMGGRTIGAEVLAIDEKAGKDAARDLYRILEE